MQKLGENKAVPRAGGVTAHSQVLRSVGYFNRMILALQQEGG